MTHHKTFIYHSIRPVVSKSWNPREKFLNGKIIIICFLILHSLKQNQCHKTNSKYCAILMNIYNKIANGRSVLYRSFSAIIDFIVIFSCSTLRWELLSLFLHCICRLPGGLRSQAIYLHSFAFIQEHPSQSLLAQFLKFPNFSDS